jgi:Leucine-rich repeat (LRR) protein
LIPQNPRRRGWLIASSIVATTAIAMLLLRAGNPAIEIRNPHIEGVLREQLFLSGKQRIRVSDLNEIHSVSVTGASITGPVDVSYLPNLEFIDLSNNLLDTIPEFGTDTNLTTLLLASNRIRSLDGINSLKTLRDLDLERNQIQDLLGIQSLTSLISLNLSLNEIHGTMNLAGLRDLEWLELAHTGINGVTFTETLVNLEYLDIRYNQVTDLSPLKEHKRLRVLRASDNQVDDLSPVVSMPALAAAYLQNNSVEDLGPLLASLPRSVPLALYLSGNPLSTTAVLDQIPALQKIGITVVALSEGADDKMPSP